MPKAVTLKCAATSQWTKCLPESTGSARGRWVRLTGSLGALAAAAVSPADPFISVVAEALAPAMDHVYALLWRAGLLEIVD